MHVLPDGRVLTWGMNGKENSPGRTNTWVWDPVRNTFEHVPHETVNLFCAGHAFLPDGRLLIAGGHLDEDTGIPDVVWFDWRNDSWSTSPAKMNAGRWYPTVTVLPDGEALVLSGSIDPKRQNDLPQVWARDGGLRDLPGARLSLGNYPWMFVAPNGDVFKAGPEVTTRYLDRRGAGAWRDVASRVVNDRDAGSAVLYDEGRILVIGGGDPPTATAEVMDLRMPKPEWRLTQPMSKPRRQLNATLLPDGKVLVTGGTGSPGHGDETGAVREAEIWDPETETWLVAAVEPENRVYHSAAVLLPDGRVLAGGGWAANVELYEPPYLFEPDGSPAVRPRVMSAPDSVGYDQTFFVETPDADRIVRATLIRLSSATHAFNLNQRLNRIVVRPGRGADGTRGVQLETPAGPTSCPPGHYLLFLLDGRGVPSIGRVVRIA